MYCPICDQKTINCDCTEEERRMYCELEEVKEKLPRWISLDERLPPDLQLVLVNHEGTGIEMAARQPDGQWVICWTGFLTNGFAYTHWMPLPEPPEDTP